MSFDSLAPHYRWMEWLLAGRKLQRCRTTFLPGLPRPRHALLLGEGNGRFLPELLAAHPGAPVTCVDASAAMIERARARLRSRGINPEAVEFVQADVLAWSPPRAQYDLVVAHFFFDCFRRDQIERLVDGLDRATTPDAQWLLSDFCVPPAGLAKWRARWIVRSLYIFFRRVTGLAASHLIPAEEFLVPRGYILRERRLSEWGLLHADWWTREAA